MLQTKIGRLQTMVDETAARRARGEAKIAALTAEMAGSAGAAPKAEIAPKTGGPATGEVDR
jgi:hypothetical protein